MIECILRHLHLPTEVPAPRLGRAPPLLETWSFNQDTDIAAFDSYARSGCAWAARICAQEVSAPVVALYRLGDNYAVTTISAIRVNSGVTAADFARR